MRNAWPDLPVAGSGPGMAKSIVPNPDRIFVPFPELQRWHAQAPHPAGCIERVLPSI